MTWPLPSMFGGRDSSRITCGCCSLSSAASSIVRIRSSSGMNDEMTLSVVVFPAPVPPATMMLIRPRTHASRNCATGEVIVPNSIRSSAWYGSAANFRIVSAGPSIASGGITAFTREPSGRRASTYGRRLVHAAADLPDDLVDRPAELLVVVELRARPIQLAGALHVDRVPVVDHDLRDLRVTDERLQRTEAKDAVADLADDEQLLLRGERSLLLVQELAEALVDQTLQFGVGQRGVVQARTQGLDQALLHARANLGDPVSLLGLRQAICERHGEVPP